MSINVNFNQNKKYTNMKTLHLDDSFFTLGQGFPTLLLPCTPSAFRQMSMYPYSISTDKHVPRQNFDR